MYFFLKILTLFRKSKMSDIFLNILEFSLFLGILIFFLKSHHVDFFLPLVNSICLLATMISIEKTKRNMYVHESLFPGRSLKVSHSQTIFLNSQSWNHFHLCSFQWISTFETQPHNSVPSTSSATVLI